MARTDEQTNVRLPVGLKAWLWERAASARRSLTSEITVRLEESRNRAEKDEAQAGESARASSTPANPIKS